ncbi:MAG TPA: hypothetical protein VGK33_10670 [Chloroflexota bacterium]|jgi:hypothetical protein
MRDVGLRTALVFPLLFFLAASSTQVVSADAGSPWIAGPSGAGDNTYAGFIDSPVSGTTVLANSTITVTGWVVDKSGRSPTTRC